MALAEHAVAPQQIAATEARETPLGLRAPSECRRPEMDAARLGGDDGPPSCAAQPPRQVEDLHVGGDPFVETPGLLPRRAAIGGGRPLRPGEQGSGLRSALRALSLQACKPRQRHVAGHTGAVDPLSPRRQHHRRDGPHCGVERHRGGEVLQAVRVEVDIVVEHHDHLASSGRHAAVHGLGKRPVPLEAQDLHAGPFAGQRVRGLVGRAVVDEDHPVLAALRGEVTQAARGQIPVVVGKDHDVDRRRHGGAC